MDRTWRERKLRRKIRQAMDAQHARVDVPNNFVGWLIDHGFLTAQDSEDAGKLGLAVATVLESAARDLVARRATTPNP